MHSSSIQLECLEITQKFGRLLGRLADAGDIICLDGDLGAGKTTLTQSIGRGVGIPDSTYINSPSFALLHEYQGGRLPLYHMDFYRLYDSQDIIDNGLDEYMYLRGVSVIEWSTIAKDVIPVERLDIFLKVEDNTMRTALITSHTESWRERIASIAQAMKD